MASPPQNSDLIFPAADVAGELNPGRNTHFHVDPTSSEVDASKEQAQAKQKKNERQKKDALQTIKSAIIISGIVVAVAGAAFAITKKLREK
ncbi:hypothetical protein GLYMA_13G154500v4 [Glycine max]|uniref:Transmembrane protein n=2 Tax=Glycine subgen. Soja TaxID=1462606 RepID=K7M003_SOYBN|nr:hypothetical protein JHK84_036800 [Glycine max]KRH20072.1 hypothetical protein GLYMA_13G154500v4 [Glycine max]RZB81214.1 hypothetical protein D0Y65_030805 [Glycine soja]|eukprot:XP_006594223.1 uncharacterized protein LOC102670030 [Glycine max]